ncbi:MAG: Na+/H+ antiporter subunit E [Caldimonas sp.]
MVAAELAGKGVMASNIVGKRVHRLQPGRTDSVVGLRLRRSVRRIQAYGDRARASSRPAVPRVCVSCTHGDARPPSGNRRKTRAAGHARASGRSLQSTELPRRAMFQSISLLVSLFLFWLLLSGYFTPFLLAAGLGSALAVVWFARRMDIVDREGHPIHLAPRAAWYSLWLLKEIAKSAWAVSRIILSPALPISPTLVRFKPTQRTDVGLVIHAQSITLTPGTITIEAGPDEFLVHGLTRSGAKGTIDSEMDRRVTACEDRP